MTDLRNGTSAAEPTSVLIVFRLYITGNTVNSQSAQNNLTALCQKHWPGRHEIEIVDILQDPLRALNDNIIVTPTLLKLAPQPTVKVIGDLNGEKNLLIALWLDGAT